MSSERPIRFVLPSLIESGLVSDNLDEYAYAGYPRDVVSPGSIIIVEDYGKHIDSLDVSKKKRLKLIIEHIGVVFSQPCKHNTLMETGRKIYRNFMDKPEIFGDSARQNKFFRRIIKQLSLPFGVIQPDSCESFSKNYLPLLNQILDDYAYYFEEKGATFEEETWKTIFHVIVGICDQLVIYKFGKHLSGKQKHELRKHAFRTCFSAITYSGTRNKDEWDILLKYGHKWSTDVSYLTEWGKLITLYFQRSMDMTFEPLDKGNFQKTKPDDKIIQFQFFNLLKIVDNKSTITNPEHLTEITNTIRNLVTTSREIAYKSNDFIVCKYSASLFLRLFGAFITFMPELDLKFDQPVSTNIQTILLILANFYFDPKDQTYLKLLAYAIKRVNIQHPLVVASFLIDSPTLYGSNPIILPLLSNKILELLPSIDAKMVAEYNESSYVSTFISSAEYANIMDKKDLLNGGFNAMWKLVKSRESQFRLISYIHKYGTQYIQNIKDSFSKDTFSHLGEDQTLVSYLISLVSIVDCYIRFYQKEIPALIEMKLFETLLFMVSKIDVKNLQGSDYLICAALQLILNLVEWGQSVLANTQTLNTIFDFLNFIQSVTKHEKGVKKGQSWFAKQKHYIRNLVNSIVSRINIHLPIRDFFTRKYKSSQEINEAFIIKKLNLDAKADIKYFTVGNILLVSFIQSGKDLVVVARGSYGKTFWRINDDYKGKSPEPKLSDDVPVVKLTEPVPLEVPSLTREGEEPLNFATVIPASEFEKADNVERQRYKENFSKWLNWDEFGYYEAFNTTHPYLRPRVIDFLVTLGLIDGNNSLEVRLQKDTKLVQQIIKEFDDIESLILDPIVVHQVLSGDKALDVESKRMTPLFEKFFKSIGETFTLPDNVSTIPPVSTAVPSIAALQSLIVFLTPAMMKASEGIIKLNEIGQSSLVRIIFNETNADIKIIPDKKPKQFVLVVSPKENDLYYITEIQNIKDITSPFEHYQVLSIDSLRFNISLIYEQFFRSIIKRTKTDFMASRLQLIEKLCGETNPLNSNLGAVLTTQYSD